MKRSYTILIDTREQVPLRFPTHLPITSDLWPATDSHVTSVELHTAKRKLPAGDYLLQGHEGSTIVERKGSLREVFNNTTTADRVRFVKALDRLADACKHPVLLLEEDHSTIASGFRGSPEYIRGVDQLVRDCLIRGIILHLGRTTTPAQRKALSTWTARVLINGALADG